MTGSRITCATAPDRKGLRLDDNPLEIVDGERQPHREHDERQR